MAGHWALGPVPRAPRTVPWNDRKKDGIDARSDDFRRHDQVRKPDSYRLAPAETEVTCPSSTVFPCRWVRYVALPIPGVADGGIRREAT